jgi:hypothetical protein
MIDARQVALQGLGGPARSIALQGITPATQAQPAKTRTFTPVYSPGVLLSSYYDDVNKKYDIPVDVDLDDEDDIIATILIQLAYHVL